MCFHQCIFAYRQHWHNTAPFSNVVTVDSTFRIISMKMISILDCICVDNGKMYQQECISVAGALHRNFSDPECKHTIVSILYTQSWNNYFYIVFTIIITLNQSSLYMAKIILCGTTVEAAYLIPLHTLFHYIIHTYQGPLGHCTIYGQVADRGVYLNVYLPITFFKTF